MLPVFHKRKTKQASSDIMKIMKSSHKKKNPADSCIRRGTKTSMTESGSRTPELIKLRMHGHISQRSMAFAKNTCVKVDFKCMEERKAKSLKHLSI